MPTEDRIEVRYNRLTRRWRFNIVASNNKVVGGSQRYRSKDAVWVGIKACERVLAASPFNVTWL